MAKVDLGSVERAAVEQVLRQVRRVRLDHPDEQVYAAMFHAFYGDGENISWPCLSVGTEESLKTVEAKYLEDGCPGDLSELRFSGADLPYMTEPAEAEEALADEVNEHALSLGGFDAWSGVYQQFLEVFPRAARKARKAAIDEGLVDKKFIVVALDEAMELVPASLTKSQLATHFPALVAEEREKRRILALPDTERVAALLDISLRQEPSILTWEDTDPLLVAEGEAAVPGLVAVLEGREPGEPYKAAQLAAEINHATPELVAALEAVMNAPGTSPGRDIPNRAWAASALSRLGRMDLIAERINDLPKEVVVQGLGHPYGSFRDVGNHAPLDYRPLEAVLEAHPEFDEVLLEYGGVPCRIDATEVAEAERGTTSRWRFIRDHAEDVLERYRER